MAGLMLFAGWFHYHKRAPKLEWFPECGIDDEPPPGGFCWGWVAWAMPVSKFTFRCPSTPVMDAIDAGKPLTIGGRVIDSIAAIPLPHEWILKPQPDGGPVPQLC